MLLNFSVENFGPIEGRQTLSMEADKSEHLEEHYVIHTETGHRLLKLGLIFGPNGSGKSFLLKGLTLMRELVIEPMRRRTDAFHFTPHILHESNPSQFSIEFLAGGTRYLFEVAYSKHAIHHETLYAYSPKKYLVYSRITGLENQTSDIRFGNKLTLDKNTKRALEANTLWNRTLLASYLKTNVEVALLTTVANWFSEYLGTAIWADTRLESRIARYFYGKHPLREAFVQMLAKVDSTISGVTFREVEKIPEDTLFREIPLPQSYSIAMEEVHFGMQRELGVLRTWNGRTHFYPLRDESLGMQQGIGLAVMWIELMHTSSLLSIDSFGAFLHPELLEYMLVAFLLNTKQSQLIATTHYRELLNNRDLFREDAIWFTDKPKGITTELYSLADFDSSVVRDTNNVLNAYKAGKLGGVPNLGDYYINVPDGAKESAN